jgi:hypothetical protein
MAYLLGQLLCIVGYIQTVTVEYAATSQSGFTARLIQIRKRCAREFAGDRPIPARAMPKVVARVGVDLDPRVHAAHYGRVIEAGFERS